MYKFDHRWVKIFGLLLDIIGTIVLATAILNLQDRFTQLTTLEDLEEELSEQIRYEYRLTLAGIILIFAGFMFIMADEIYSSFVKHKDSYKYQN